MVDSQLLCLQERSFPLLFVANNGSSSLLKMNWILELLIVAIAERGTKHREYTKL